MVERLIAAAAALAVLHGAGAEPLPDPTRPAILPPSAAASGASAPPAGSAWVLQSVRLGAGRAQAAVINGQLVTAGDRLGDARLLRVTERSAVLEGPNGIVTLWLIADVDKHNERAAAPPSPAKATP